MFSFEPMSYRDDEAGLRAYREELLAERRDELASIGGDAARIFARRAARMAGGLVAIAGALAMALTALFTRGVPWALGREQVEAPLTPILSCTVIAAPIVALVTRVAARAFARPIASRLIAATDDVRSDVATLSRSSASALFADHVDRMEVRSVSVPLVGAALVVPLALHLLFAWIVGTSSDLARGFDFWILLSLVLTIPAHTVLALMAVRYAKKLRAWRGEHPAPSTWAPLLWTVLAGCVPGLVLYLIPPILVAITGLFVPLAFTFMRFRVTDERARLDAVA